MTEPQTDAGRRVMDYFRDDLPDEYPMWLGHILAIEDEAAALAAAEAAPLDAERLARAIALAIDGVEGPIHPSHRKEAEDIAREYAALRSTDTRSTWDKEVGWRPALRSPDTETAGEAG